MAVDGVVQRRYVYDGGAAGNGNRTEARDGTGATLASATYDAQDRLLTHGSATHLHSANGERTHRIVGTDTTRTTYDALGSLVGVRLPNGDSLRYLHDGLGRRVARRRDGAMERGWLYGDGVSPLAELDGAGALMNRHVHATRGHVPDLVLQGDTAHRVVTDHLGSVRAVVRTTDGLVVQRREYDAWGVLTADTGGVFQSLGYAGGLTDTATRLVRFGARDYDPEVGRWTTKDPIGFAGGDANLYAYAGNVPSSRVDPTGLIARAGSRPLHGTPFMVDNPVLPGCGCDLKHTQFFFEDLGINLGVNIGSDGKFGINPDRYPEDIDKYVYEPGGFNENILLQATVDAGFDGFMLGLNNCQIWMIKVRARYYYLVGLRVYRALKRGGGFK